MPVPEVTITAPFCYASISEAAIEATERFDGPTELRGNVEMLARVRDLHPDVNVYRMVDGMRLRFDPAVPVDTLDLVRPNRLYGHDVRLIFAQEDK